MGSAERNKLPASRRARQALRLLKVERGAETERRVLAAFARPGWLQPDGFVAIVHANEDEDHQGVDYTLHWTGKPSTAFVQIKSSECGRLVFEVRREWLPSEKRLPIGVAVITRSDCDEEIRNKVIAAAQESLRLQRAAGITASPDLSKKDPLPPSRPARLSESPSMQANFVQFAHEVVAVLASCQRPEFSVNVSATEIVAVVGDIKVAFVSARVGQFVIARRMSEQVAQFVCDSSPSRRRNLSKKIADDFVSDAIKTYQSRIDRVARERENEDRDLGRAS